MSEILSKMVKNGFFSIFQEEEEDVKVLHPDHPKVYARGTVIIGGGKSLIKWAEKPPTTRKSTAKLSHIAECPSQARTCTLPEVRD